MWHKVFPRNFVSTSFVVALKYQTKYEFYMEYVPWYVQWTLFTYWLAIHPYVTKCSFFIFQALSQLRTKFIIWLKHVNFLANTDLLSVSAWSRCVWTCSCHCSPCDQIPHLHPLLHLRHHWGCQCRWSSWQGGATYLHIIDMQIVIERCFILPFPVSVSSLALLSSFANDIVILGTNNSEAAWKHNRSYIILSWTKLTSMHGRETNIQLNI